MKASIIKYGIIAALGLAAAYLAVQIFTVLDRPYRTETAILYDMSDSLSCGGYLVFEQSEVPGEGQMGYLVSNGERVATGTQVAEIYSDPSQARARTALTELDAQLELLERSENTVGTDVDVLLAQRQSALYDLLDGLDRQNYEEISSKSNEYLLALNRLQITTGAIRDFSGAKELIAQEQAVQQANLGSPAAVTVSTGGYFVAADAAQMLLYSQDELDNMSAAEMADACSRARAWAKFPARANWSPIINGTSTACAPRRKAKSSRASPAWTSASPARRKRSCPPRWRASQWMRTPALQSSFSAVNMWARTC